MTKALIRHKGETVRDTDGIVGIDWKTGAPLTNPEWCDGPYHLVDNYVEPEDGDGHVPVDVPHSRSEGVPWEQPIETKAEDPAETEDEDPVDQPVVTDEYVIIDGVKYKRA